MVAALAPGDVGAFLTGLLGDADRATSVLHHRGLWVAGRVWDGEALPAGTPLSVYAFGREPEPVTLPEPLVLWDDGDVVALHKPAWLPTQGTRASRRFSLEHRAAEHLGAERLTAVHRLDRETSGVVLFARTNAGAARMHRQFRARTILKTYLAGLAPLPPLPDEPFRVRGHLVRVPDRAHATFALGPAGGEPSETWFAPLPAAAAPSGVTGAWVYARPITGRTHQIRVHLASQGWPIAGDTLYGPPADPAGPGFPRLQLHALTLTFSVPGRSITVQAPPPPDLLWPFAEGRPAGWVCEDAGPGRSLFSHAPRIALGFGR